MTIGRPMVVVPMFWIAFSMIIGLSMDIDSSEGNSSRVLPQALEWDEQTRGTVDELIKEPVPNESVSRVPTIGFIARYFGYISRTFRALWEVQKLTIGLSNNVLGLPPDAANIIAFFGLAMNLAFGVDLLIFIRSG